MLPKRRQQVANGVDDRNRVRARLALHSQSDDLLTVVAAGQTIVLDAVDDVPEVAQHHGRAVAISDNQLTIAFGVGDLPVRLDGQILMNAVEGADREIRIAALQGRGDIVDANAPTG